MEKGSWRGYIQHTTEPKPHCLLLACLSEFAWDRWETFHLSGQPWRHVFQSWLNRVVHFHWCGYNRGSKKLRISDAACKKILIWYLVFAESRIAVVLSVQTKSGKGFKDNLEKREAPKWRNRKASPYCRDIVSLNPSVAGSQGSKIGCALRVGGMAYSPSPVNHSDTTQSFQWVHLCERGQIALSSACVTSPHYAAWAAVRKNSRVSDRQVLVFTLSYDRRALTGGRHLTQTKTWGRKRGFWGL